MEPENGRKRRRNRNRSVEFWKLFSFADHFDISCMIVGTIAAVANGFTQPVMALLFGQVVNAFGGTADTSQIIREVSKVSLDFVYLAIGAGVASFIQMVAWMITGERQAARIRALYLKNILRQDIEFFDTQTTTGEIIGRLSSDTILIQEAMGEKVGKFIQFSSAFLGGFIFAFIKGWRLALVLSSSIPAVVVTRGCLSMALTKMSTRCQAAYVEAGNVVEETVGAIRTVSSYTTEKRATVKYENKLHLAYIATMKQGLASGLGFGVVTFLVNCTYSLAIWYGSNLILTKGYNGGDVINVIRCILIGGVSLGQTSPCLSAFSAGQVAAYTMFETIKRNPSIDASSSDGIVLENMRGEIEFREVRFQYPARPEVVVFDGFSIHVPHGKTVALVGQSGSGKSTVISLVERFYDPDSGDIFIDGVSLKKLNLKWIRGKIGLVSQEPNLFATTIRENILYGKEDATDEEIREATQLANASKFIEKLPQGLDTNVGEHGTQLSGGQKQRIAIARAILRNPKILLLDEATSALDAESERVVQNALENVMANRTTIVVAHRLTTIRNADVIAVVRSGKLIEQGSHDELISDTDGDYSQLVRMQEKSKHDENNTKSFSETSSVTEVHSNGSSRHSYTFSNELPSSSVDAHPENMGDLSKRRKRVSIRRLAKMNKPEIPYLLLGSAGAAVHGLLYPIYGLLVASTIKIFYKPPEELKKGSKFWSLMFLFISMVTLLATPAQNYFFGIAGGRLIQRISSMSFKKVVHQDMSWFDDPANSSGSIGARLSTDASTIRSLVGDALGLLVQNITTIVAGLIIAFTSNWLLAILIFLVLPLIGLQGFFQTKFLKGFSNDAKVMYEGASQIASDAVRSIRTVAAFNAEEKVMKMYEKKCETPIKNGTKLGFVTGASYGIGSFALYCAQSFCFYIGAVLVRHNRASFGDVFRVFYVLTTSATGISQASALAPDFTKVQDASASIFDILDRKSEIDSSSKEGIILTNVKGDIEFQHVSFKYPTRPDIPILKDLSLKIPSGKPIALVGESGSGKSTVITLLQRFYDPGSGRISLDGLDLDKFNLKWLRQQMGLVSQEPILFNETIKVNIAYGRNNNVTEEEIMAASQAANAHSFISTLPDGYNTNVGERGIQLSGGQKQRIAIARAILKDPKILLLDEATSALDAESERLVQEALDGVMVDRTTIVVAHRLSTIIGVEKIAVVKNGVVCERGSHHELMEANGVYASLVALSMTSH